MLAPRGNKHPSGKPQYNNHYGTVSYKRVPHGYLSPGLQKQPLVNAIGFMADFAADRPYLDNDVRNG